MNNDDATNIIETEGPSGFRLQLIGIVGLVVAGLIAVFAIVQLNLDARAAVNTDNVVDTAVGALPATSATLDWLPDGNAIVGSTVGHLYLYDLDAANSTFLLTVPNVNAEGERGALDLAVDPNFANNGYIYVYATRGPEAQLEVIRFTMSGNTISAGSETVIWVNPGLPHSAYGAFHAGGSLNFGNDGKLYLTTGDGFLGSNSQDVSTVWGKILRINANGTIPGDNPDFGPGAVPGLWAIGLRNPFRTSFDADTGNFWIGDVGGNVQATAYEEVNLGQAGANYGWPNCEGPLGPGNVGPDCPSGVTGPIFSYRHIDGVASGTSNSSITGGEVFRSSQLGAGLNGAYIYGDWARGELRYLELSGTTVVDSGTLVELDGTFPTWIGKGPDDALYYVSFSWEEGSELHRVISTDISGIPPTITTASADTTSGTGPLTVNFTGAATHPDSSLTYRWSFGDGATSTEQNPSHTYPDNGSYEVRLLVTAANGQSTLSDAIHIAVGNGPTVTIESPASNSTFIAGDTITLTGSATDDIDDPGDIALSWSVGLRHDNHTHPTVTASPGATLQLPIPATGHDYAGDTYFIATLTATDSDGLSSSRSINLRPREFNLTVASNLEGVPVAVSDIPRLTPSIVDSLQGFVLPIDIPSAVCVAGKEWDHVGTDGVTIAFGAIVMPASDTTLFVGYAASDRDCAPGTVGLNQAGGTFTTGYDDPGPLLDAAAHLDMTPGEVQQAGVHVIRFLNALGGVTDPPDLTGTIPTDGATRYTSSWTAGDTDNLDWVTSGYAITPEEAHAFGGTLLAFFAALDGAGS